MQAVIRLILAFASLLRVAHSAGEMPGVRAAGSEELAAFYKEHAELPRDGSGPWIELIGKSGAPNELRRLFSQIASGGFSDEAAIRALNAISKAAEMRSARPTPIRSAAEPVPEVDFQTVARLLDSPKPKLMAAAARLAGNWKIEDTANRLAELAESPDGAIRLTAMEALRRIGGKTALTVFAVLARPYQLPETRRRALVSIAEIQLDAAVVQAAEVLPLIDNEADALETWRGLLKVERAATAFAVRLPKYLPPPVLAAGVQAARELGKSGEPLLKALAPLVEASEAKGKRD